MDNKISFSINGDPTRGYKNVAFRGLLRYTSQAYLTYSSSLTDGSDTYICYITDKAYEIHIVTSPSKIGGQESRGAFNVGIAIPKGYEIKSLVGTPISISEMTRKLREKFAEIAMTPNKEGLYLYDERSLDSANLNKSLSEWLDQEYQLLPVSRKEIIMTGGPEIQSRARIRVPSVDKIDEFFEDPHFSELNKYGSVEVVSSPLPSQLKLDIPRRKNYDLTLIYAKNNAKLGEKTYTAFFKSETEQLTLPIGDGVSIQKYEKFNPQKGLKRSLEELRRSRSTNVSIDSKNEVVAMRIEIEPKIYKIEIKWSAVDGDGRNLKLTKADLSELNDLISFECDTLKRYLEFDPTTDKSSFQLSGAEVMKDWKPVIKKNDSWKLDNNSKYGISFNPNDETSQVTLRLQKISKPIILNIQFYDGTSSLPADINKQLLKNLKVTYTSYLDKSVEKPKIDTKADTITFDNRNIQAEWGFSSNADKYTVDSRLKINQEEINKGILKLQAKAEVKEIVPLNNGGSRSRTNNSSQSPYEVVVKVFSKKRLQEPSVLTLKLPNNGQSEKVDLRFVGNQNGVYEYNGRKGMDKKFEEAEDIFINGKRYNYSDSEQTQPAPGRTVETITIKIGNDFSKYIRKYVPILIILVIGFLMGALTQRFCNLPFPIIIPEETTTTQERAAASAVVEIPTIENDTVTPDIPATEETSTPVKEKESYEKDKENPVKDTGAQKTNKKPSQQDIKQARANLMADLKKIEVNKPKDQIAARAREISKKHLKNPNLDTLSKNFLNKSFLKSDDDGAAAVINKIIKQNWDPYNPN